MLLGKFNIEAFPEWLAALSNEGGTLLIDKATDWTSFDAVAKVRSLSRCKKVGHAGTLDPLATGLLILCLGKATKTIESYQNLTKEYIAEFKFGATTKTDDSEADEENICDISAITNEMIISECEKFIGNIEQIPPAYCAKKIGGKKMYELARKNEIIEAKPAQVEIYSLEILEFCLPIIKLKIKCSKGTYIRALARDMGRNLGVGAYMSSLRRTAIGDYNVDNALSINDFSELIFKEKAKSDENIQRL